ncbi:hypothetical protein Tco_0441328 [Tanacetum coccineum]
MRQANDSFSTLEIKGLAFQEVAVSALTSSALCPFATSRIMAIIAISTASVSFILSQRSSNALGYQCLNGSIGHRGGGPLWRHFL